MLEDVNSGAFFIRVFDSQNKPNNSRFTKGELSKFKCWEDSVKS